MRKKNHFLFVVAGVLLILSSAQSVSSRITREYEIKTAFIYNFAKFVEWPQNTFPDNQSSFVIGVLGQDVFGKHLDALEGKILKDREVRVKRYHDVQEISTCHMLFISSLEGHRLPEIFKALKNKSVLTIGDMPQFNQSGGVINFILEDNKVRFEINSKAADQAGLTISSHLLRLAQVVY